MMRTLVRGTAVLVAIGAINASSCQSQEPPPNDQVINAILAVLKDGIVRAGPVSRLIPPPSRSYQHRASDAAVSALGHLLSLPTAPSGEGIPNCHWAPADSSSIGMAITVTEFDVVGDSAHVSILHTCRERQRGRTTRYELEPTWILRRQGGHWAIVQRQLRVTSRPANVVHPIG